MVKIVFLHGDGSRREVDAAAGSTIMRTARDHGIDGIAAECGGFAACGTCHVYVDATWAAKLPLAMDDELAMLEVVVDPRPNSRLSCQLAVAEELDGIVVQLPPSQY
jgi:2Fe-2S ferredoxin